MLQQLKFKTEDYDEIWFMSDAHLNQESGVVLRERGFSPFEKKEHDDYLEWFWHQNITPDSLVINTGDITFNDPKGEFFEKVSKWPCKEHILLWGNHNSGSKDAFKSTMKRLYLDETKEVYPTKYNNVVFVGDMVEIKIDGKCIVLSHFPLAVHNNAGKGWWHLCGHSHHTFPDTYFDNPDGLTCDIGVDSAFRYSNFTKPFFTWEEIKYIMSMKTFKKKDHHDEKTT